MSGHDAKHIYTKEDQNGRWRFGFESVLRPSSISWSFKTWTTEAKAKHAAEALMALGSLAQKREKMPTWGK